MSHFNPSRSRTATLTLGASLSLALLLTAHQSRAGEPVSPPPAESSEEGVEVEYTPYDQPSAPGQATAVPAAALPASDACQQSAQCRDEGRCTSQQGRCVAISAADCATSRACTKLGKCTPWEGQCVAAGDCVRSQACQSWGRCTAWQGSCVALSDGECARSRVCETQGRCVAERGRCVQPAAERSPVTERTGAYRSSSPGYAYPSYRPASTYEPQGSFWRAPQRADKPEPIPYREGDPIPAGYRVESTPRYGLVGAGAATLGGLWAASVIGAVALDNEPDGTDDPNFDDRYWPLFIPVVGPLATIGTADSSGTGAAILALDGVLQAGGLAMLIAGYAAPTLQLVPSSIRINPVVAPGQMTGLSLSGSM